MWERGKEHSRRVNDFSGCEGDKNSIREAREGEELNNYRSGK